MLLHLPKDLTAQYDCIPVGCGNLVVEICPIPGGTSSCSPTPPICSGVSACSRVQYAVRLRTLSGGSTFENFNLRYRQLSLILDLTATPQGSLPGFSIIDTAATIACNDGLWDASDAISFDNNNNTILFRQDNNSNDEYDECSTSSESGDVVHFTDRVCHLFNVVVLTYPGEEVDLVCNDFLYDPDGPGNLSSCSSLTACSSSDTEMEIALPDAPDENEFLSLDLYETTTTGPEVTLYAKNANTGGPITITEMDIVIKAEFDAAAIEGIDVALAQSLADYLIASIQLKDGYYWIHLSPATGSSGLVIPADEERDLINFQIHPMSQSVKSEVTFTIDAGTVRVNTNFECSGVDADDTPFTIEFGEYELCGGMSPYAVEIIGSQNFTACDEVMTVLVRITSSLASTLDVYYFRCELQLMNTPMILVDDMIDTEWGGCPAGNLGCGSGTDCVSFTDYTAIYCLNINPEDPGDVITIDNAKYLKIEFKYQGSGCIQKENIIVRRMELGVYDPVGQVALDICAPDIYFSGFPLCPLSYQVTGEINTEVGDCVEDVSVESESVLATSGQCVQSDLTKCDPILGGGFATPHYALCVCPAYTQYRVTPIKNDNPLNGVTTYDLVLISKHILGIEPLGSPYKIIASNVNGNTSVTAADIVEIRKLILGIYSEFPDVNSWRFFRADYTFSDPDDPFTEIDNLGAAYFESPLVNPNFNNAPTGSADFIGIKMGDVNNTVIANSRPAGQITLSLAVPAAKPSEYITVPVMYTGTTPLEAYQLALRFDPQELEWIGPSMGDLPGYSPALFGLTRINEGILRTLWLGNPLDPEQQFVQPGATLFYLTFRALTALSETAAPLLQTDDSVLASLAWHADGTEYGVRLENGMPEARSVPGEDGPAVYCLPNPATGAIGFRMSGGQAGKVRLSLYGAFGNRLAYREIAVTPETKMFTLDESAHLPAGIYLWEARAPWGRFQGRVVKE